MLRHLVMISAAAALFAGAANAQDSQDAEQTAPTTPQTAATPSAEEPVQPGAVVAVTEADVRSGATVTDQSGQPVGTVESVSAEGAVVSTGTARGRIPFSAIGKTSTGLVTTVTKAQIEAAAPPSAEASSQPN
ncbi:hypothetical protein [Sphingosinicella rhizophila]|uniref:Uncharacterized protein n=1 Tax=Sphingosinicella rhizophila TaxID=3050082 RepID=A0ABU3QBJ2_9SPHN|nr:hypothetical protein [Sphingosinicella sp. GR2756]MDT9600647.1 hypothetical protein [Sphingosinicella sp. GR2756]